MNLSHSQRIRMSGIDYPKTLASDYEVRSVEDVMENGRIMKKSVTVTRRPQDMMKGFCVADFAMENILAAGALDALKERRLSYGTRSEVSDSVEGSVDRIIDAVDAAENNVQNENG